MLSVLRCSTCTSCSRSTHLFRLFGIFILIPGSWQHCFLRRVGALWPWPLVLLTCLLAMLQMYFFFSIFYIQQKPLCQIATHKILMGIFLIISKRCTIGSCTLTIGYKEMYPHSSSTFPLQAGRNVFGYAGNISVNSVQSPCLRLSTYPFPISTLSKIIIFILRAPRPRVSSLFLYFPL